VPERTDYDLGHAAGEISARLADHDKHFASINGSLERVANEMHDLVLAVQRLADQAEANAKTVITTAAALKDAEAARRDRTEQGWEPWQKALAVLGGLGVVVAIYFALRPR
jgi:hypothetical protein